MGQGKQAKVLSPAQIRTTLQFLQTTRNPERDTVIFLLSVKSALRAKEVSEITWAMVTDPQGNVADAIQLQNVASKGKNGGRTIPLNKDLKIALLALKDIAESKRVERGFALELASNVISSERGSRMSPNSIAHWFKRLYSSLGFDGCSSHSGRRSAITTWSRNVSRAGGSLRDVQNLAGHSSLAMTQLYIEQNTDAQKTLVDL
ncbi:site-specific integrase [Rhodospirillales bacterium]|nr:site-specific integrase [Rhodospirillales bacterium]